MTLQNTIRAAAGALALAAAVPGGAVELYQPLPTLSFEYDMRRPVRLPSGSLVGRLCLDTRIVSPTCEPWVTNGSEKHTFALRPPGGGRLVSNAFLYGRTSERVY